MNHQRPLLLLLFLCAVISRAAAQHDTAVQLGRKVVTLTEVVVHSRLNVAGFIERVKNDTTFYKAFKNLKVIGYSSLNDIRMLDKQGRETATLQSKTRQTVKEGCRSMEVLDEKTTGDMYDANRKWNYYTAELYAGLFFTNGTVCGDNNIVKGAELNLKNKSGIARHKEQLKMLFFNPGKKIPGIPFIGNKIALFDDDVAKLYLFTIDMDAYKGEMCYVFRITARDDLTSNERDNVVINDLTTWFRIDSWEIVARKYDLSYKAGVYSFNVKMEAELNKFGDLLVPTLLRYDGFFDVILKGKERGLFTA